MIKIKTPNGRIFTEDKAVIQFCNAIEEIKVMSEVKIIEDFEIDYITTDYDSRTGIIGLFGVDVCFEWSLAYNYSDYEYTVTSFQTNKFTQLVSDALKECISEKMYTDALHQDEFSESQRDWFEDLTESTRYENR